MNHNLSFDGESILVVGGCGFVGSNLIKLILKKFNPKEIVVVDNLLSSETQNLPNDPRINLIIGSISEIEILQKINPNLDYIFHLACFHGNQSSIASPIQDHENNTLTSLMLFEFFHRNEKLKKVVYSAAGCAVADKTYGNPLATEEDSSVSLFHDSPYSISKLIGEMYGNYYFQRYGFPFVKARFQNVYGPGELLGAGRWRGTPNTVWRNVIPTFIWKAMNKEALPLENEGESSRDFIFIDDIAEGLISCALSGVSGEAYNLATGEETKIIEIAKIINSLTKNDGNLKLLPKRDWDNSGRRFGSTKKSKEKLNFTATTSIEDGLEKTVHWFLDNFNFIKGSIEKHELNMSKFN